MSGINDNGAFDTFARMEEKVDRAEAEAEASVELAAAGGDQLEQQFKELEGSDMAQEDALASLKSKMGVAPAPALPSADAVESVSVESENIEAELDELLEQTP